ncbi:hypothetical protein AAGS40_23790 [Paraburkholderia sp. PREW-6R]|uniref:hypothetical protein n=1 Tax=Paraburkholderia sp. PREW-6R TaxID=3141544 RepID=UPI0031F4B475
MPSAFSTGPLSRGGRRRSSPPDSPRAESFHYSMAAVRRLFIFARYCSVRHQKLGNAPQQRYLKERYQEGFWLALRNKEYLTRVGQIDAFCVKQFTHINFENKFPATKNKIHNEATSRLSALFSSTLLSVSRRATSRDYFGIIKTLLHSHNFEYCRLAKFL